MGYQVLCLFAWDDLPGREVINLRANDGLKAVCRLLWVDNDYW